MKANPLLKSETRTAHSLVSTRRWVVSNEPVAPSYGISALAFQGKRALYAILMPFYKESGQSAL
jgi:hypothetical protein